MRFTEEFFESRALASKAAADRVADALVRDLGVQAEAALIVSGGSTPQDCFKWLSNYHLGWDRIQILISDERCVEPDHAASNEGMIRRSLLTNCAAKARLLSVCGKGLAPSDQCDGLSQEIDTLPLPFSTTLLGLGKDGHFASLFPDFDRLAEGLDPDSTNRCLPVMTAASPHQRITLTMSTFIQSREILLLFFGLAKREVYEQAKLADSDFPVSAVLRQDRTPVRIIWAP